MNIWIIAHNAGSPYHGPNLRLYYLARRFTIMGHPTSVISASYFHKYFNPPEVNGILTYEAIDGINYCWVRTWHYASSGVRRFLNHAEFVVKVRQLEQQLELPQPDAVIGSSPHPLITYNCIHVARRYDIPFVFDVRDLWPLTLVELGGFHRYHPVIWGMEYFEKLGYRQADYVVSVLPGAKQHMTSKGMAENKFVHIPNGIDVDEVRRTMTPIDGSIRDLLERLDDKFLVAYVGSFSVSNALKTLVDAACILQKRTSRVHILLVGKGRIRTALVAQIEKAGLYNVSIIGPISKRQVPAFLEEVDISYAGALRSSLYEYGVSANKLFDYMFAGKPIVQSINTQYDLVKEANCGVSVEAEDSEAVADAIYQLFCMSEEDRATLGQNGRRYVEAHHNWAQLAERYISLLQN